MPRRARIQLAGIPVHVIQRGNNRSDCFFGEDDYAFYLDQLADACRYIGAAVHAYVLMTNHVHLLMTAKQADGVSRVMKRLGQRYVQYVNRTYGRSGTLWEGRFRSCLVGEKAYLLGCYRYIELNPVRAGTVARPADYRWSSYRCNAQGRGNPLVSAHRLYLALGKEERERRTAYRALFRSRLEPGLIDEIRQATNGGFVLGSERFQKRIAAKLGRRTWRGVPGRPRAAKEDK